MTKNRKKKLRKKPEFRNRKIIIFFILLIFALLSIWVLPAKQKYHPDCANSISCIDDLSGTYDENITGEFEGRKVTGPALNQKPFYASTPFSNPVLGDTTAENKRIEIDLSKQRLYAFENNIQVFEFPISSGKPWWATPNGDFRIWIKLRFTRMKGGSKELGTYYNLPNVPYTMYFYNDNVPKYRGYGIHGAYWHNNFGFPMSHGCVNMRESDVAQLYNWATPQGTKNSIYATAENPGTLVRIYGETPK